MPPAHFSLALFRHCCVEQAVVEIYKSSILQRKKDTKCPVSLPPTVNFKTSAKNGKIQIFLLPSMALLFIAALLMSTDRRQSQSSRKFAWAEFHLSCPDEKQRVYQCTVWPSSLWPLCWQLCHSWTSGPWAAPLNKLAPEFSLNNH